jgi:hypothetical protein
MSKEKGGRAFPAYEYVELHRQMMAVGGMTLRDYFAAKAMQGLLSNPSMIDRVDTECLIWIAQCSHEVADAMLEARK